MPGIQSRGRGRITPNKIEQVKTQNKIVISQSEQNTAKYKPRPASGQLDQSTQNQIQPTTSNIEQARIVRKAKTKHKLISKPKQINTPGLSPIQKFGLGVYNTGSDYANTLNTNYEDKSVLNQAIGHVFEGKWDKAGQVIQNNPYRFAGNLAVEVGSTIIPVGWVLRGAKVGSTLGKVARKIKPKIKETPINFNQLIQKNPDLLTQSKQYPGLIKKINKLTPEQLNKFKEIENIYNPEYATIQKNFIKNSEYPKASQMESVAVTNRLVAAEKVGKKKFWSPEQALLTHSFKNIATEQFAKHFGKKISPSGNKILMKSLKEEVLKENWGKGDPVSNFERTQIDRKTITGKSFGAIKNNIFRQDIPSRPGYKYSGQQSYDPDMAKKWAGLGLGLGGAGIIGGVGLSEADSKKNKDKSFGGYGRFL